MPRDVLLGSKANVHLLGSYTQQYFDRYDARGSAIKNLELKKLVDVEQSHKASRRKQKTQSPIRNRATHNTT